MILKFNVWCSSRRCAFNFVICCLNVDDLICKLKGSGLGCHIASMYFGCIMYADDFDLVIFDFLTHLPCYNTDYD